MKRYREMTVASSTIGANGLARYIEDFAEQSSSWIFTPDESSRYEELCGRPSCCVTTVAVKSPRAAIHLTEKSNNSVYVTNIVPLDGPQLSIDQYNELLAKLARQLRIDIRKNKKSVVVNMTSTSVQMRDVVSGRTSRKFLDQYLSQYPRSGHSSNIDRLDKFICALSRFQRKRFDLEAFEFLLAEEYDWPAKDARSCRSRVEIGLEVLAVNRGF